MSCSPTDLLLAALQASSRDNLDYLFQGGNAAQVFGLCANFHFREWQAFLKVLSILAGTFFDMILFQNIFSGKFIGYLRALIWPSNAQKDF